MNVRVELISDALLVACLVTPWLYAVYGIRCWLDLPELFSFALVLLGAGAAAEFMFFATMVSTNGAVTISRTAGVVGLVATANALRHKWFRDELRKNDFWMPFAVTAAAGFAYLALFCIAMPDDQSPVAFAEHWLIVLPDDNVFPYVLAQHIAAHLPPKPFIREWLSSDRPPLQAGFELVVASLTPFVNDSTVRYQAFAMLLQTTIFGMLFSLCRLCGCVASRSGAIVVLAWLSGFFLVNTEFVWPKLIAATFVAISVAICMPPARVTWQRAIAIGAASGLGLLSHGGVVFTLPALVVAFIVGLRRRIVQPLLVAFTALVLIYAPWSWYQKVYDPPGDRLLKWHLAGQIAPTNRGFLEVLHDAYFDVPPKVIITNKISNVGTMSGLTNVAGTRRGREFFFVRDALAALVLPFAAALCFMKSARRTLRWASHFAWIAVASLTVWAIALYLPNSALVHVGSYCTILLMFAAAGIVATEWPAAFVPVFLVQAYDFVKAWLVPFDLSSINTYSGCFTLFLLMSIIAICIAAAVPPILALVDPERMELEPGIARFVTMGVTSRRSWALSWIQIGVFVSIGLIVPIVIYAGQIRSIAVLEAVASPPATGPTLPVSSKIAQRSGRAIVSLDAFVVNGKATVVAGLSSRRTFRVAQGDTFEVTGWAFDPVEAVPAGGVVLRFGAKALPAVYGIARPDVAAAYKMPNLTLVGFDLRGMGRSLPKGANPLSLLILSRDLKTRYINQSLVTLDVH